MKAMIQQLRHQTIKSVRFFTGKKDPYDAKGAMMNSVNTLLKGLGVFKSQEAYELKTTQGPKTRYNNSVSQNSQNRYNELCPVILEVCSTNKFQDLGILAAKDCLHHMRSLEARSNLDTVSLRKLLERAKPLKIRDRLQLGLILASAAIQLHGTVWLNDQWGNDDICFLQDIREAEGVDGSTVKIREPLLERPLVRYEFKPSAPSGTRINEPPEAQLVLHDDFLYSLGLILIELWFGKPGKDIDPAWPELGIRKISNHMWKLRTEAGDMNSEAVASCLNGVGIQNNGIKNDEYQKEVEACIVSSL
ncbi:Similar to Pc21g21900 [Penicillium chrysogenum Wisconsin 54-1255]; acc. no. XP_002569161 [Pyronema omphalodes CBS 100304]|uniref:Similar to Pc21g21900 [Penicillium chrysogenum Wisconsin 54-1255] acc. no. XP_002569161 n=1 Tax=Pyronema omphalodes (strain CBS 100304) TaxID=1076935 RepID=U4L4W0_PYROM|nr:Similar to Pc21g21900 [Penicillium chrysogenum Wisconsin 54-1255]; acc. no. XP_002569161 [Pyronema omphalodes CBS 100304]